jgi:hypothetical protein
VSPTATTGTTETLSTRRLGRATLARQLLLEHPRLGVVEAVERIGGLQAPRPSMRPTWTPPSPLADW